MPLTRIPVAPGVVKDDPNLSSEGKWVDTQWVRFRLARPETIPGWQSAADPASTAPIRGIPRLAYVWADNDGAQYVATGTTSGLFVWYSQGVYDITPIVGTATLGANPLSTISGSTTVGVTHAGAPANARVHITGATAVNGVGPIGSSATLASNPFTTQLGSTSVVVTDASHGMTAGEIVNFSGASAVGGITVSGDYTVARILTANAYEIHHSTEATSSATGGGGAVVVKRFERFNSSGGGGNYSFTYTSFATGTGSGGGSAVEVRYEPAITDANAPWSASQWGQNLLACARGGGIYEWALDLSQRAAAVSGAPARNNYLFVTPERFVVSLGTIDLVSGDFEPMLLRWSDQSNNTVWTPSATNLAGDYRLADGTEIVAGAVSKQQNLIWTDNALYSMRYLGDIDFVFGFDLIASGCGLIGPNAFVEVDGIAFWMAPNQQFYMYSGGVPQVIPCPVLKSVFADIATGDGKSVFAAVNTKYTEVWWFYRNRNTEVRYYVAFNWTEGVWFTGTIDRTAMTSGVVGGGATPIGFSSGGSVYYHETGTSADGGSLECSIEMAYTDIADGDRVMNVRRIVPDLIRTGDVTVNAKSKRWPNGAVEQDKTRTFATTDTTVDLRLQGRQVALKFSSSGTSTSWRLGDIRVDMDAGGFR